MEIRINREIRDYTESMFFGLSLRQFFFSVLACGVAVGIYFGLRPLHGLEATSWLCIVAAFSFAAVGFLKYNGMTAEKFIWAWIKSTFLMPKVLTFGNTNLYYSIIGNPAEDTPKSATIRDAAPGRRGRKREKQKSGNNRSDTSTHIEFS